MSSSEPLILDFTDHQEQMLQLDAGAELRCLGGSLRVHFGYTGLTHILATGQAVRLPDSQWISVSATGAARVAVMAEHAQETQAQKNRQGFAGLWRLLATRLMVRRGPRAA